MKQKKYLLDTKLNEIVNKIKRDNDVVAIMLFGSYARTNNKCYARDIDICVMIEDFRRYDVLKLGRKRLTYLNLIPDIFDIQIFLLLPLYIRIRVLKEGVFLFIRNPKTVYDIAYDTIKEYDLFESHYLDYIRAET